MDSVFVIGVMRAVRDAALGQCRNQVPEENGKWLPKERYYNSV